MVKRVQGGWASVAASATLFDDHEVLDVAPQLRARNVLGQAVGDLELGLDVLKSHHVFTTLVLDIPQFVQVVRCCCSCRVRVRDCDRGLAVAEHDDRVVCDGQLQVLHDELELARLLDTEIDGGDLSLSS